MISKDLQRVLDLIAAHPVSAETGIDEQRRSLETFGDYFALPDGITMSCCEIGGVTGERLVANEAGPKVLYLHGGGYVMGSSKSHRHLAAQLAAEADGVAYVPDYRLAPEAPFPAALDDASAVYGALLAKYPAETIAVGGDSAGGGLAIATLSAAREADAPLPACLFAMSPWVNLRSDSASYVLMRDTDPMLTAAISDRFASLYASSADVALPPLSPLNGTFAAFPPTLLQAADREVFLGDVVQMHQNLLAQGVESKLEVWKDTFHVWQLYWPKLKSGRDALRSLGAFVADHCAQADKG